MRHFESKHLRTLALAGLLLLTAAAGKPAWSGLPDWRRYLEIINPAADIATELRHYQVGQVVSLGDPRFSASNVRWGLWVPQEFLPDTGAGLYFLKEYDRGKIPILFVHGSGGNPTDLRPLIKGLDRSRYQPWVYYYNDGAVTVASELDPRAQVAARRTFGFNEYTAASSQAPRSSRWSIRS